MNSYTQNYIYDAGTNLLALQHQDGQRNTIQYQPVHPYNNRQTEHPYDEAGNQLQNDALDEMVYNADGQLCKTVRIEGDHAITEYYAYLSPGVRSRKVTETHETQGGKLVELKTVAYVGGVESRANYIGQDMSYDGETVTGDSAKQEWTTTRIKAGDHRLGSINKDKLTDQTTLSFSLSNHIGSTSCELDEQGQIIGYESYYPYGGIIETLTGSFQELGYSGQELDSTQLNYYGHRYYDASTARWNRPDPIRFNSKQLNLYAMVGGNPVTYQDFWGLNQLKRVKEAIKQGKLLIVGEHHKYAKKYEKVLRVFDETKVFTEHEYYRNTTVWSKKEMGDDTMLVFKHFASLAADPNLYKTSEGIGFLSSYSKEISKLLEQALENNTLKKKEVPKAQAFQKHFADWVKQVESMNNKNITSEEMAQQWKNNLGSRVLGDLKSSRELARKRSEHMWDIGKKGTTKGPKIWFVGQVHIEDILKITKKEKPHNGVEIFTKGQWMEALLLESGKSKSYIDKLDLEKVSTYADEAKKLFKEAMSPEVAEKASLIKMDGSVFEKKKKEKETDKSKSDQSNVPASTIPIPQVGTEITFIDKNKNESKNWKVTGSFGIDAIKGLGVIFIQKDNMTEDSVRVQDFGKTWKQY